LARLGRLARVVRRVGHLRSSAGQLWILYVGISDWWRTLFWVFVVLGMVLFICGLAGVVIIGKEPVFLFDDAVQDQFGDSPRAMFTMLQLYTGDSWGLITRPIMRRSRGSIAFFFAFMGFAVLVLSNVMVAVVVQYTMARCRDTFEEMRQEALREANQAYGELEEVLRFLAPASGELLIEDLWTGLQEPTAVSLLRVLSVTPKEVETTINLVGGKSRIAVGAFCHGLRKLRERARGKDVLHVLKHVREAQAKARRLAERSEFLAAEAFQLQSDIAVVHKDMCRVLHVCSNVIALVQRMCTP